MKKIFIISFLTTFILAQQTTSYSWEDGTGTILGSYGNLSDPENVGTTSGVTPYDGSRMLTVSESPIDGTPQAFIAWVTNISAGDEITACYYGYDNTPNASPSLRIWGSWTANDDINSYQGSADGNSDYTDGSGWSQICHTFTTDVEVNGETTWDTGEALAIQARLYSSTSGSDPTVYFLDLIEITAPNNVIVNYPGGSSEGCTNSAACNYNPFATEDDGSCIYPTTMSIYDIQYTADQGEYCYESDYSGTCVTTTGVVTAESPEYDNFYIQDANSSSYAGIYVHNYQGNGSTPTLGQNITITAWVNEYYSLTQLIDAPSSSVNSSGNSIAPTSISTGDLVGCTENGEMVEGMLVKIENVIVTAPSNEYGEWYVDDGTGPCKIDDKMFDGEWLEPSSSQEFQSITGVVDYAYSEFSIFPRTMVDIVLCPTCPVADAGEDQFTAPNSLVTLNGSNSYDPNGDIIASEWIQTSGTSVGLSDEESLITTFTAPSSNGDLTFELTIYDNDQNVATDMVTISVGTGTSIEDIQCPEDLVQGNYCYETSFANEQVTTYGIVTHVLPAGHSSEYNFFLQQSDTENCGGIFIRDFDIAPSEGDEIILTGTVNEYYSFTQINDVSSSSINSYNNSIAPLSINTGDLGIECSMDGESLESMLVKVTNVTIEDIDEFGNIQINDGSGPTLMDDYYFNGNWPTISIGDEISSIIGVVGYSYSEFKIYPRKSSDLGDCPPGDLNGDGGYNVLDIVALANCILSSNCGDLENGCAGDLNDDGGYNVLDIVALANCILASNCGGRVNDATKANLIMKDNAIYIQSDGFIGGVQMTLTHDSDFNIDMTDRALFSDYLTNKNETRLLVITPETDRLFSFNGEFQISEIIVANTQFEVPVNLPLTTSFSLHDAYPNPFNPTTTLKLEMPFSGEMKVEVFNLFGQSVATLASGYMDAGKYDLTWDASNASSGMYFVKAQADGFTKTQKLMLIK